MRVKKSNRNAICENFIEAFDAIKPLPFLPGLGGLPISIVAEYFETSSFKVSSIYNSYKEEFADDEVKYMSYRDIRTILEMNGVEMTNSPDLKLRMLYNGQTYMMGYRGQTIFPRKAILRLALIIPNNSIANGIREYIFSKRVSDAEFFNMSKTNRLIYGDRVGVIRDVPVIEGMDLIAPVVLDDYLGLKRGTVAAKVRWYYNEVYDCGITELTKNLFRRKCQEKNIPFTQNKGNVTVKMSDGNDFVFQFGVEKIIFLSRKAALRIIMVSESEKAQYIHRKLREQDIADDEPTTSNEVELLSQELEELYLKNEEIRKDNEQLKNILHSIAKRLAKIA